MKKAFFFGLSLALLLSLAACHKPQADRQDAEPNQSQAAVSIPATTPEPPEQTPAVPEPLSDQTETDPDGTEDTETPEGTEPQEPVEEVELFEDVNETVYATGTVNLRSSWSASSAKIGSLTAGQSVTRTGVSIAGTEAEGWSRVVLSTGDIGYVSNRYLSATKPVVQQQQQPVSNNQQETPVEQQPAAETQKPAEQQSWQSIYNQVELTPEAQAILDHLRETDPDFYIDEEGALHSAAANGTTGKILN